jgi:uncharacterized protein YjiK
MKLELVREEKLYRLLPGGRPTSRLEASGVALANDATALVVFDNLNLIARIDVSLERKPTNRLLPAPSLGLGFEDIAIAEQDGRLLCLIEALEDFNGAFRGFVAEYEADGRFIRCTPLPLELDDANKGYEGLEHARRGGRELLYALHESSHKTGRRYRSGRIDVFERKRDGGWKPSQRIRLPKDAELEDYAALAYRDGQVAIVSQASARVWVARIDEETLAVVPGSSARHRFPSKDYGNVEGIAWLSADTLVAVSDRRKKDQPTRCADKDQSIHVFRIPST